MIHLRKGKSMSNLVVLGAVTEETKGVGPQQILDNDLKPRCTTKTP
jgi:hypothetical protein